jgi:hypothetical protein
MGRKVSFEEWARAELELIKGKETEKEQRLHERMRGLAEQARQRREVEAAEESGPAMLPSSTIVGEV